MEIQEIGKAVTEFSLHPVEGGEPLGLNGILAGKRGGVVVFWSGMCSHCVRYDAYFNNFAKQHPDLGFAAIASRFGETPQQIQAVRTERKLAFPILFDPGAAVAKAWFTQQTPRSFLFGADRTLHYRGAVDNFKPETDPEYQRYLEPAIGQFLAGEALTRNETASFGCAIQSIYYILPNPL